MMPPVTLLSSPMIERVQLRELALARHPQSHDQEHVDQDWPEHFFGQR
jgi:hypothetical protein